MKRWSKAALTVSLIFIFILQKESMNYNQAKNKMFRNFMLGILFCIPSLVSIFISILKMFYFKLDDGSQFGQIISKPFKDIVYFIYERSRYLDLFWNHSPVPDSSNILDSQGIKFFVIYIIFFIGWIFLNSSMALKRKLKKIDEEIEREMLMSSVGNKLVSRKERESQVRLPESNKIHDLYIAPLIVAIIGAIIIKIFGLSG